MFSLDRWNEIWESIRNNKLRTFLSGFTISLGILIFILLFGMGNGLQNAFQEMFVDDATNTIWLYPGRTSKPYKGYAVNRRIEFTNDDMADIQRKFGDRVIYMTPRVYRNYLAKHNDKSNSYTIRAVAPPHQYSENTIIMKGRYINEKDLVDRSKHIVIGRLVEKDLFGKSESALGVHLNLGGITYKVVGIFQDDGGDNEERLIYMPYTTAQMLAQNTDEVDQIIVGFEKSIGFNGSEKLAKDIEQYLRLKHEIHPEDDNGIYIRNASEGLEQTLQFVTVLKMVVSFVGLGTLLAGVIGISNIMMFVVQERTKELGIRKALGATPFSVIAMVLQESVVITIVAGYIGIILGILGLRMISDRLEDFFIINPYVDLSTIIGASIVLILSGLFAGYIPARRAARIKPVEALKD